MFSWKSRLAVSLYPVRFSVFLMNDLVVGEHRSLIIALLFSNCTIGLILYLCGGTVRLFGPSDCLWRNSHIVWTPYLLVCEWGRPVLTCLGACQHRSRLTHAPRSDGEEVMRYARRSQLLSAYALKEYYYITLPAGSGYLPQYKSWGSVLWFCMALQYVEKRFCTS